MNLPFCRATLLWLLCAAMVPAAIAQSDEQDPQQQLERLRRDQDEILRKAGRLRDLMDRLLQRYTRENKAEQVDLLQKGLQHLERSGLLKDVASIRDDLAANALSDALRKQQEVITDIERLLNILLQRRSIENLEQEITQLGELADRIREAEQRQEQLQKDTQRATERDPSADEQAIDQQLQQLAREQASEAQKNARAAGTRRPFLEDALRKVDDLLQQQQKLERRVEAEQTGKATDARQQMFDLGSMLEQTRELAADVKDQARKQDLQQAAEQLDQAAQNGDPSAMQQARDKLQSLLQRAPLRPDRIDVAETGRTFQELRQSLENAPSGQTPAERTQLQELAQQAKQAAAASEQRERQQNAATAEQIAAAGEALRQQLDAADPRPASERKPGDATPASSVQKAQAELQQAADQARTGDAQKAQASVQAALRSLDEARSQQREQNPDAQRVADQMAAQADAAERDLRNAPSAEKAEEQAAAALASAEQALRQASQGLQQQQLAREGSTQGAQPQGSEPQGSPPQGSQPQGSEPQGSQPQGSPPPPQRPDASSPATPEQTATQLEQSRQALEEAKATLEEALKESGSDRAAEMAQAKERQQELRQRTGQAKQGMQQAQQRGAIDEKQAKAATEQVQRAEEAMARAEQSLQQGQQSTASQQQRDATQALQQAQQAMKQNQKPGPEQQQAMKDLAEQQKNLEEEILRLAEEAKQRKNPEARRSLEEAAESARKAQQAMQQGDEEESQQQQEQTKQKLEEAAKELEEERDRYLDQRQEELLFRMKEELTGFLEKQQPMTLETIALQKEAESGNLSRPSRRKLNQFSEEEQSLASRIQTMVTALTAEGNLVYRTVLQANHEDLQEVARRLAGRNPDPSRYTTMLQQDTERRTRDLLAALEREQKRREQEQKDQQQQQEQKQPGENKFNEQRKKLVSLIAELEMLKQLEKDTSASSQDLQTLISLREGDNVSQAELALVERLMHRHGEITKLFQQIKAGVEETMQGMQQQDGDTADPHGGDDGSGGRPK